MGGKGQWVSGAQNPSRIRATTVTDDSGERQRLNREQDDAFTRAMCAAPEGRPLGVCKTAGNEHSRTIAPPVDPIIPSSSGW